MAVRSFRELAGRTFQHRFGESPTAEIRYALTLDDPATSHQEMLNSVGIFHGSLHPEYLYLVCTEGSVSEADPDPWHASITYRYEVPLRGTQEFQANPLARPDVWSFSTAGSQVPALTYYSGSGNGSILPLVNGAGDFFEGLTTDESEVRASISGNRSAFPLATAAAVTNALNNAPYLGGAVHTWKCAGISAQQATEVVNDIELNYWQVSVELIYRQSGWPMLIPHVGWNYLVTAGGEKRAAYVIDPEDGSTKLPSSTPQPLNSDGTLKYAGAGGAPDLLTRRLHPEVDFSAYFGTPPF
jgi:hypothetical protein